MKVLSLGEPVSGTKIIDLHHVKGVSPPRLKNVVDFSGLRCKMEAVISMCLTTYMPIYQQSNFSVCINYCIKKRDP